MIDIWVKIWNNDSGCYVIYLNIIIECEGNEKGEKF